MGKARGLRELLGCFPVCWLGNAGGGGQPVEQDACVSQREAAAPGPTSASCRSRVSPTTACPLSAANCFCLLPSRFWKSLVSILPASASCSVAALTQWRSRGLTPGADLCVGHGIRQSVPCSCKEPVTVSVTELPTNFRRS